MGKIVIANWKTHPDTLAEAQALFSAETVAAEKYPSVRTVICPPTEFLSALPPNPYNLSPTLGAQDVFWTAGGDNFGVQYVLVGHSDRRYPPAGGGDTDEVISQKLKIALNSGIMPILLVGEKEQGADRRAVIEQQLTADLTGLTTSQVVSIVIAYEPVWAISTNPTPPPAGGPDKPESTLAAIKIINDFLAITYNLSPRTYLYGGSINPSNIADFLHHPEISGAVIGQASLDPVQFGEILRIVSTL